MDQQHVFILFTLCNLLKWQHRINRRGPRKEDGRQQWIGEFRISEVCYLIQQSEVLIQVPTERGNRWLRAPLRSLLLWLNVCVPQNSQAESLTSNVVALVGWRWLGHEGRTLTMWLCPYKRDPTELLTPPTLKDITRYWISWHLDLGFPSPQNCEK